MKDPEIPLTGGNVNEQVVRIGRTVRRTTSKISPTAHKLLQHLEAKGFTSAPRFLGIDEKQREILSFIDGETGITDDLWRHDQSVIATAELLRAYHEVTLDFPTAESPTWGITYPDPSLHEVICHNDFAPYNFIFRDQIPHAIIDFDLVGPGPRLRDIAYAVYWLTPLSFNDKSLIPWTEKDLANGNKRLKLFCKTYNTELDTALFDMIFEVLTFMGNEAEVEQVLGAKAAKKLADEGHLAHWQQEAQAFAQNRHRIIPQS